MGDRLALARFEQGVFILVGKVRGIDAGISLGKVGKLPQFLGSHGDLMRAAPPQNHDALYP